MSEFMENRNNGIGCQLQLNLMCKPFTLILDNSRLDMTVLPRTLAETMGATAENGRYLQLEVRPDWMDSSDLIGWLNLEGKFIPGAIVDFFKKANSDPEHTYFLCLNQIILSRAEYYLRDLITAVDMRGEPDSKPYVPKVYFGRDEEAIRKYGEIPPLKNLFIVGTVNLDESSLPLPAFPRKSCINEHFWEQTQHKKKRGEYTSLLLLLKSKIVPDGLHDPQQRLGERGIGIVLIGA